MAGIAEREGDLDAASKWLRKLIDLSPSDARVQSRAGDIMMRRGYPPISIHYYEKAVALSPKSNGYKIRLARALDKSGLTESAISVLRKILKDDPNNISCKRWLDVLLRKKLPATDASKSKAGMGLH